MCYWVEYLRATRALRIVAILLGIVLLGALVLRFSWGAPKPAGPPHDYLADFEHSPTAHVSVKRLANGDTLTTIDDRVQARYLVIERHGKDAVSVSEFHTKEAYEYSQRHPTPNPQTHVTSGGVGYSYSTHRGSSELGNLLSLTIPMGLLVATLLAGILSKENNGHLELVWTKPVSREAYALTAVLVDVATLVIAQLATAVAFVIAGSFWEWPKLSVDSHIAGHILVAFLGPFAWYACLTAFSASQKRGPGIVLGIGWVLAIIVPQVASSTQDALMPVGRAVHAIFSAINYLNPLAYTWGWFESVAARGTSTAILALVALALVYLGAALLQWRRLEA